MGNALKDTNYQTTKKLSNPVDTRQSGLLFLIYVSQWQWSDKSSLQFKNTVKIPAPIHLPTLLKSDVLDSHLFPIPIKHTHQI